MAFLPKNFLFYDKDIDITKTNSEFPLTGELVFLIRLFEVELVQKGGKSMRTPPNISKEFRNQYKIINKNCKHV